MSNCVVAPFSDEYNMPPSSSYHCQQFLLPTLSPNIAIQWLTSPFTSAANENKIARQSQPASSAGLIASDSEASQPLSVLGDYFGFSWQIKPKPGLELAPPPVQSAQSSQIQSNTYTQSLMANQPTSQQVYGDPKTNTRFHRHCLDVSSGHASESGSIELVKFLPSSVEGIDELVASPSPYIPCRNSPHDSTRKGKTRAVSVDSNEDRLDSEQNHRLPESVERDGMIWGLKVEVYRTFSARERKKVRNRISARAFRAKRKEQFNLLESALSGRDSKLKHLRHRVENLRWEVENLNRRLSKYEKV